MVKEKELKEFNNYIQDTLKIFKGLGDGNLAFIQGQYHFHSSYLSYQLLNYSKRIERLTITLIFLTIILAALTGWNIWLLIN